MTLPAHLLLITSIELDTTIQCRADIDIATVNEYAEAMQAGVALPPIDVFGSKDQCWIGDGWHRVMAAKSAGLSEIEANLQPGGRIEALKHALAANATHGRPRTNKDKRCTVAIALREFGKLSDAELARMCAVDDHTVSALRRVLQSTSEIPMFDRRLGADGKERPAAKSPTIGKESEAATPAPAPADLPLPDPGPPRNGISLANAAIGYLKAIRPDDLEREQAFQLVRRYLDEHNA